MISHVTKGRRRRASSIQITSPMPRGPLLAVIPGALLGIVLVACGGAAGSPASPTKVPSVARPSALLDPSPSASPTSGTSSGPSQDPSQEPDTGTGAASGDVPDNAVFLTYTDAPLGFSVQYVEGWQVRKATDGVIVADKDSSETVRIVPGITNAAAFASGTDLPALRASAGFKLMKQDTVRVGAASLVHLVFRIPSPPDPVTGKQVPSTVDRYYVPGANGLAVVTLSTPNGVDNVDAFRQMIESFKWT